MKNNGIIIIVVIILLIAGIGAAVVLSKKTVKVETTGQTQHPISLTPTSPAQINPTGVMGSDKMATASDKMMPTRAMGAKMMDASNETKIIITNFKFNPAVITVKKGTKITWTNNDSAPHNVTADDKSFESPTIKQGDVFNQIFDNAGTFAYSCTFHAGMIGSVVVQ